jgi:hypothetical protein
VTTWQPSFCDPGSNQLPNAIRDHVTAALHVARAESIHVVENI